MANIKDLIHTGRLTEARKELIELVKTAPADTTNRTLLFQVLVYLGEFTKAESHLKILAGQDSERLPMFNSCQELLTAEKERLAVLSGKTPPSFLPDVPPCSSEYQQLLKTLAAGRGDEADDLRKKPATEFGSVSGTVNGTAFTKFEDTDTALTWFLEAFVHERYLLIPFTAIRELNIATPANFLDLCWISAQVTMWKDGLALNCYLPVLYAKSYEADDEMIRLGRKTSWSSLGGSAIRGAGQHVFETDSKDYGLLEIREMSFDYLQTEDRGQKTDG